jgi:hypothetical protein
VRLVACELRLASFGTGLGPEIYCSRSTPAEFLGVLNHAAQARKLVISV